MTQKTKMEVANPQKEQEIDFSNKVERSVEPEVKDTTEKTVEQVDSHVAEPRTNDLWRLNRLKKEPDKVHI